MRRNPFTPNFGQVPKYLAGREMLIREVADAFDAGFGHPGLTSLFVGARGTGKTALLSLLAGLAQERGWIAVNVACIEGMLEDVIQQTSLAAAEFIDAGDARRVRGVSVAQMLGVEWDNERAYEPNWRTQMSAMLDQLERHDIGLLITVDEIDPDLDEMVQLASTYQLFVREGRKVALLMAGLPSHVSELLNDKSVSFLRRSSLYELKRIDDYEVETGFARTAESAGRQFSPEAMERAVEAAEGFPYMIQLVGYRSWQESGDESTIGPDAVARGAALAEKDMEHRVLRASLDGLSLGDLRFLEAMLPDEGETAVSDLERRLGKSSGYVARYRRRLIDRGLIGPRRRGFVGFDLPGLRAILPEYLEG